MSRVAEEPVFHKLAPVGVLRYLVGDLETWRRRAACRYADWTLFEPATPGEYHGKKRQYPDRAVTAAKFCASCPVSRECYTFAKETHSRGVWGGVFRRAMKGSAHRTVDVPIVLPGDEMAI